MRSLSRRRYAPLTKPGLFLDIRGKKCFVFDGQHNRVEPKKNHNPARTTPAGFLLGPVMDLNEARNELFECTRELMVLDDQLRVFWNKENQLRDELIRTYPHAEIDHEEEENNGRFRKERVSARVTGLSRANGDERKNLLAELDRLNKTYRPVRNRKDIVRAVMRGLERFIIYMEKIERKEREKRQRSFKF